VPSDYKVKTQGYADFIAFSTTAGPHPTWDREHWMAFIRSLSLNNASGSDDQEFATSLSQAMVSDYARRFKTFYSSGLHELVPLPLSAGSGTIQGPQLSNLLHDIHQVQVIGRTGSGKSHLARHLLLDNALDRFMTVFIEAGMYDGRLSALLDRSVARFSSNSAAELFRAAAINGQEVLLVVDGLNECPQSLSERLNGDLSAFCLRVKARLLVTSQFEASLPGLPDGVVLHVAELEENHRRLVLSSYGSSDIYDLCQPFSTAYELSMAAECASELEDQPTRAGLLMAFVRRRLSGTQSPALTRDTLRQVALAMDERLVTSMSSDDVWRIAEEYLSRRHASVSVIDDVFACAIARSVQGRFMFTHELLGRFLAAEGLLQQHHEPLQLAQDLDRPRHDDLRGLVLGLERDPRRLEALLAGLADWHLYALALFGEMGPSTQRTVRIAALDLLGFLTQEMEHTSLEVHPEYQLEVSGGHELSHSDGALLAAIGVLVFQGEFVHQAAALLDATDAACRRSADEQARRGRRPPWSTIVATVLVGFGDARSRVAAAIILDACTNYRHDGRLRLRDLHMQVKQDDLSALVQAADARTYGRLLLLCSLLRQAGTLDAAALAPHVLRLCWASGAYHVQLEGLMMVQLFTMTVEGHRLEDEIVGILEELNTNNIMLSTALVETMHGYGLIEPPSDSSYVSQQIQEILGGPATREGGEQAYTIVSNQFEDVIGEPYYTALDDLSHDQRIAFYALAATWAPIHGMWNGWLLKELIGFRDRRTLPALERWATQLGIDTPFVQEVSTCYALAMQGRALFLENPPRLVDRSTDDLAAWECYGSIIFWLHFPGLEKRDVARRCLSFWLRLRNEYLPAAGDPLFLLSRPSIALTGEGTSDPGREILAAFPEETRSILEWSLEHRDNLTSILELRNEERDRYLVGALGLVGDEETSQLLRAYVDDPALGRAAIDSIKRLATEAQPRS
jgi:hypothetical protein